MTRRTICACADEGGGADSCAFGRGGAENTTFDRKLTTDSRYQTELFMSSRTLKMLSKGQAAKTELCERFWGNLVIYPPT